MTQPALMNNLLQLFVVTPSQSRDKFSRPSPNLSSRLARQSTSTSTTMERLSRPSEEQRLALMQKKSELYDKLQRGELEGVGEREMGEWVVDVSFSGG
jgi:hypothetical protein